MTFSRDLRGLILINERGVIVITPTRNYSLQREQALKVSFTPNDSESKSAP